MFGVVSLVFAVSLSIFSGKTHPPNILACLSMKRNTSRSVWELPKLPRYFFQQINIQEDRKKTKIILKVCKWIPFLWQIYFLCFFQTLTTPWTSILKSVPVWALLIVQSVQAWGFWMLLTEIPIYMTSIMRFDIKQVQISGNLANNRNIKIFIFPLQGCFYKISNTLKLLALTIMRHARVSTLIIVRRVRNIYNLTWWDKIVMEND